MAQDKHKKESAAATTIAKDAAVRSFMTVMLHAREGDALRRWRGRRIAVLRPEDRAAHLGDDLRVIGLGRQEAAGDVGEALVAADAADQRDGQRARSGRGLDVQAHLAE